MEKHFSQICYIEEPPSVAIMDRIIQENMSLKFFEKAPQKGSKLIFFTSSNPLEKTAVIY